MDIPLKPSGEIDLPPEIEKRNNEMRAYYINYMEMGDGLGQKINALALAIKKIHQDWSLSKIAQYICLINQDLDKLVTKTVYNNITDENRIILGVKKTKPKRVKALPNQLLEELRQQKGTQVTPSSTEDEEEEDEEEEKLQNNVTEEKIVTLQSIVPEESSRTNVEEEDEEEPEEEQEQDVIYDNPEKMIKNYEEQIIKINKAYEELETKYNKIVQENKELLEENRALHEENIRLKKELNKAKK